MIILRVSFSGSMFLNMMFSYILLVFVYIQVLNKINDLGGQAHVRGQPFDWMNWALLWRKHIKISKAGYILHRQKVSTETKWKNLNQTLLFYYCSITCFIVYYNSVHAYIKCWDAWVNTRYVQLQISYNNS